MNQKDVLNQASRIATNARITHKAVERATLIIIRHQIRLDIVKNSTVNPLDWDRLADFMLKKIKSQLGLEIE
jgi:hypothetical protein